MGTRRSHDRVIGKAVPDARRSRKRGVGQAGKHSWALFGQGLSGTWKGCFDQERPPARVLLDLAPPAGVGGSGRVRFWVVEAERYAIGVRVLPVEEGIRALADLRATARPVSQDVFRAWRR